MQHTDIIRKIFAATMADEGLKASFETFKDNWMNNLKIETTNLTSNMCFFSFLFEFTIDKKNVLDIIIADHAKEMTDEEVAYLKAMQKNVYGAFQVMAAGGTLKLQSLKEQKEYEAAEAASLNLKPGMIIYCRLAEIDGKMRIVQFDGASPEELAYTIKKAVSEVNEVTTAAIGQLLYPQGTAKRAEANKTQNRVNPEKRLKKFLAKYLGKKLRWSEVLALKEAKSEEEAQELVKGFITKHKRLFSERDIQTLSGILLNFAMHGKHLDKGPIESSIMNQHIKDIHVHFAKEVEADKYPSDEEVLKFQEKWFETKQDELEGKTPREVILAERAERGSENEELIPPFTFDHAKKQNNLNKSLLESAELIKEEKLDDAIKLLESMLEEYGDSFQLLAQLGTAHLSRGHKGRDEADLDRAKQLLQKALGFNPQNEGVRKNLEFAQVIKSRIPMMKFEDEVSTFDDKQLQEALSQYIADFSKEGFVGKSQGAVSAFEAYRAFMGEGKITEDNKEKAEVLLKAFWQKNKSLPFDFYDLETFITKRISEFNYQETAESFEEMKQTLADLKTEMMKLDDSIRQKLIEHFLVSFAFEFMCSTLPQRIISMFAWEDGRLELLDMLESIWGRLEFPRQKAATLIYEGKVEEGTKLLQELINEGDHQSSVVLATALNMQDAPAYKMQAKELAKDIAKNHTQYNLTKEQSKKFLKEFK